MSATSILDPADVQNRNSNTRAIIREKIATWLRNEAGLPADSIDDAAPLSSLGIDSLGMATISCDLERETGKRLNLEVLYELENINQIAEYMDQMAVSATSIAPADAGLPAEGTAASVASATVPSSLEPSLLDHYELLNRRVRTLKEHQLYFFETEISKHDGAWVEAEGRRMLMLGSYEYLGLLEHPHLKQAAIRAIEEFGTGHHGARLLTGTTTLHRQLERKLAQFMRAEEAIVFSSGYVTNLATISTLVDRSCCVIGDQWNHASIVDGCRMSGAEFMVFEHNNIDSLAAKLAAAAPRRTLVVVDAVFSMDGDIIDLPPIVDLCKKHRALLMVDEAHSLGVLGKTGHGIQEHFGLDDDAIDVKMGTLSKTLASSGGFVAGREEIITFLRHHARGYIFSGALPTPQTSTAIAALEVIEREPQLIRRLWGNLEYYLHGLRELGFDIGHTETPIVPVMTKNEAITLEMTRLCREMGLLVVPVAFPAVPLNAPRLRTCISSLHGQSELDFALDVLAQAGRKTGLIS
ncbi:MAG: aminotransferase class I/II-fold pyridoxal phosphate-dependent enzyme [Planctomycetales bacterium]|nr:aminotransferase class I/II-fold pyridoxal phosphate-dependent enzyme [Planctomycetales bacterium]